MEWCVWWMEALFLAIGSFFDIKSKEIPLWLFYVFGGIGAFLNLILRYQSLEEMLGGCLIGFVFLIVGKVVKGAIGMADILGFMILGIFAGWKKVSCLIFLAFVISGVYGLYRVLFRKASLRDTLPFFPFLFLALIGGRLI